MRQRRSDWVPAGPSGNPPGGGKAEGERGGRWCSLGRVRRTDEADAGRGASRRTVLRMAVLAGAAGLGSAGLVGCTLGGSGRPKPSPSPDPLAPVLTGTEALADLYAATVAAQPTLADRLDPLLAEHRAHVDALRVAMGLATPSGSASPARATPTPRGGQVPDDPAAALAAILGAERTAQASAVKDCLASRPEHAGLLGSIAASRACHLEVLG
jgi:hypothetical protein